MKRIKFAKYHALGNDFIIVDSLIWKFGIKNNEDFARKICSRNFGVGADGILVLTGSKKAICRVDVYNSDGGWAEKSGNGLRIVAAYLYTNYGRKKKFEIETTGGVSSAEMIKAGGGSFSIRVSLGTPVFETEKIPMKGGGEYHINCPIKVGSKRLKVTALSVGNPHAVMFVENFDFDWQGLGKAIEHSPYFPRRTNVEFAQVKSRSRVVLNDWERGAGATGSSGTGAAATVVAGVVNGIMDRKAEVIFPSGSLRIEWSQGEDRVYLIGPVNFICAGEYEY